MEPDKWITWLKNPLTGVELMECNPNQEDDSFGNPIELEGSYRVGTVWPENAIVIFHVDDVDIFLNDVILRETGQLN